MALVRLERSADAAVHGDSCLVDAGLSRDDLGLDSALARALPSQLGLEVAQLHSAHAPTVRSTN